MKKTQAFYVLCTLTASFAVIFGIVKNDVLSVKQPSDRTKVSKDKESLLRLLQDARVVAFTEWYLEDDEDKKLTCIVQAFDQNPNYEGVGVKLSIFNQIGEAIYEDYFSEVQSIHPSYALRKGPPQLVMEVGYGGSAKFLKMLDYRNGKVVDLMEAVENDFDISAEVRPQFRTGITPALEPYQVMLTQGIGLASSVEKYTNIYRYKDGMYRHAGKFPAQKVDNYIEKLMQEDVPNEGKLTNP